jgi:hypothetical protein
MEGKDNEAHDARDSAGDDDDLRGFTHDVRMPLRSQHWPSERQQRNGGERQRNGGGDRNLYKFGRAQHATYDCNHQRSVVEQHEGGHADNPLGMEDAGSHDGEPMQYHTLAGIPFLLTRRAYADAL